MIAVVLAAGRGTRMGPLTANTPKPLLPLGRKPILEHILVGFRNAGITEAVVVTGYRGEQIESYFGDGSRLGMRIQYRRQTKPTGTAKALLLVQDLIGDQPFALSWGDIVIDPSPYRALLETFESNDCDVALAVNRVDDPWAGAAVYFEADGTVTRLVEKPPQGTSTTNWNNGGVFCFRPIVFDYAAKLGASERNEFELPQAIGRMIDEGRPVRALPLDGFWSDLGTPEDLAAAQPRFAGRASARCEGFVREAAAMLGTQPDFIVRAPGRVNLIGEHTDYNGLPVMPMAIDRCVHIAGVRRDDNDVRLRNIGPFGDRSFAIGEDIPPFDDGDWGNYAKAAAQGLRTRLGGSFRRGANLVVTGDIPEGAGLSSSSALVVGCALALLEANETNLPYADLAELLPKAEQYVGTLSGGMDQTISLLGQAGHALRIDFDPLAYRTVPLPANVAFLVCHSLVQADKAGGAKHAYNTRVIECRLAAGIAAGVLAPEPEAIRTLGALLRIENPPEAAAVSHAIDDHLGTDSALLLPEVADRLGTTVAELQRVYGIPADMHGPFRIPARARHVLSEAARVDASERALRDGDVAAFAAAMRASHASCRDDYEISCSEIEDLVQCAEAGGALAARLTGAGFGGCIVSLVENERVDQVVWNVDRGYYDPRGLAEAGRDRVRFRLEASAGASTEKV